MMLHTKYQDSGLIVSDKKIFSCFSLCIANVNHVTLGRCHFWPQGRNLNKLGRGHQVMLQAKYQDSRSYGFRQEDFFMFFTI